MKFNLFLIVLLLIPIANAQSLSFDRDESGHLTLEDITYFTKGYQAGILPAESYLYLLSQIDKDGKIKCKIINETEIVCLEVPVNLVNVKQAEFLQNYFIRAFYSYTNVTFVEKPGILTILTGKVTDSGEPENLEECLSGYGNYYPEECYANFPYTPDESLSNEEQNEVDECLEYGICGEPSTETPDDEIPDEEVPNVPEDPHGDTPYIEKDGKKYYLDTEKGFFGGTKAVWKADDGSKMSSREADRAIKNGAQFVDPSQSKNSLTPGKTLPAQTPVTSEDLPPEKTFNPPNPNTNNPFTQPPLNLRPDNRGGDGFDNLNNKLNQITNKGGNIEGVIGLGKNAPSAMPSPGDPAYNLPNQEAPGRAWIGIRFKF